MTNEPDEREKPAAPVTYYKGDSRGLRYAELWRASPGLIVFLILAVMKLLRMRRKLGTAVPHPRRITRLDPNQLPPRSAEALQLAVAEWQHQGLRPAFHWTLAAEPLADEELFGATLLSEDGTIAATTSYYRITVGEFTQEEVFSGALSKMPDGVVVATTTRKHDYEDLPHRRVHYLTGRTITEVAAHHRYRLGNIPLQPVRFTASMLLDFLQEEVTRQTQAFIDRGVLVPMTAEEVEAERRRLGRAGGAAVPAPVARRSDSDNPYQSPAAQATSPEPVAPRPRALSWPWALLWLVWPLIFVFFSVFFAGDFPRSLFFLLIVMASNAGFVDSLYRRRLVRRPWVLGLIWLGILVGQTATAILAMTVAHVLLLLLASISTL